MTASDELRALQKDACRIFRAGAFCNDCPFRKEDGCMIERDIARQQVREAA